MSEPGHTYLPTLSPLSLYRVCHKNLNGGLKDGDIPLRRREVRGIMGRQRQVDSTRGASYQFISYVRTLF